MRNSELKEAQFRRRTDKSDRSGRGQRKGTSDNGKRNCFICCLRLIM